MEDIKVVKRFLSEGVSKFLFEYLEENIKWHDTLKIIESDETRKIKRKMAYCSEEPVMYQYANLEFMGEYWHYPLEIINQLLAYEGNFIFNSVLLNMYADGKDEINWHSDKEPSLGDNPIIACVNLGATRKFWFRKKEPNSEKFFHELSDGDLLIMGQDCQANYLHAILKESEIKEPRISLTYRYNY